MKYRAEIDGLRAVAVVPVILFHAGIQVFGGGFVGVDVFFVISGYLITTILIEDIENKRFSIANFYERRARRIFPALFLVLSACIPFAWMWMLPSQMKDFSNSLLAVSFFVSNILYSRQEGYFEPAAEEKPLLHTWSLAVEEQYYVLFPVFLFLVWRFGKNRVFWTIVVLAAISLIASEWGWRHRPAKYFYLAPTRAWELFAGSISAFIVQKHGVRPNNALSALGLAAIVFAIFAYDKSTPFPSVYSLVPVVGVVLIVLFAEKETLAARLLSSKALVGIGLISYSAYLWQQPLFAFARIRNMGEPDQGIRIALAVASLVLAFFSWKFVEIPFRGSAPLIKTRLNVMLVSMLGIAVLSAAGLSGWVSDGFDYRLSPEQKALIAYEKYPQAKYYREGTCFLNERQKSGDFAKSCSAGKPPSYFVWGDSHAAALASGFTAAGLPLTQRTASGCPPFVDTEIKLPRRPHCRNINAANLELLSKSKEDIVVLHANWLLYNLDVTVHLSRTIAKLKEAGIKNVVIVGGVPQYSPSLPQVLYRKGISLRSTQEIHWDQRIGRDLDLTLKRLATEQGVKFASPLAAFCGDRDSCLTVIQDGNSYVPVAWDYGHLTHAGSVYLSRKLFKPD